MELAEGTTFALVLALCKRIMASVQDHKGLDIKVAVLGLKDEVNVRRDSPVLPCEEDLFLGRCGLKMHDDIL